MQRRRRANLKDVATLANMSIATREDLKKLKCPDPTIPGREQDIWEALQVTQGRIAILGGVRGPFSQAWYLMGPHNLLVAFHDDPELVTSLFAVSNQYNLEAGRLQAEAGVDAFFIFDDMGVQDGAVYLA